MELLQLRYFVQLAESEQLTKTAERLHISPPSLSITIKKLEKELGCPLFDRLKQHIYLNENGKKFYQDVKRALVLIDGASQALRSPTIPKISVAMTSKALYLKMLYAYEQSPVSVPLRTETIDMSELEDEYKLDTFDFYLGALEDLNPKYRSIKPLFLGERPVVMISRANPLAQEQILSLHQLQDIPIVSTREENPSAYNFMKRIFAEADFQPYKLYDCSYLVRQKLVSENKAIGITTFVGAASNALADNSLAIIPLTGTNIIRTQSISWKKGKRLTLAMKKFVEFIEAYYQQNPFVELPPEGIRRMYFAK